MRADVTRKLFTVDVYHRIADAGVFEAEDRTELVSGEMVQISPIGLRHAACVDRSNARFTLRWQGRAIVGVQHPLRLHDYSELQPDIMLLKPPRPDYYASKPRTPEDAFLVMEVSDTTRRCDVDGKLPLYAAAGISEVWIANLPENLLLVCRACAGERPAVQSSLRPEDSISPLAFPDIVFPAEALLGSGQ